MKTSIKNINTMLATAALLLAVPATTHAADIPPDIIIAVAPKLSQADKKATLTEVSHILKECVTSAAVGTHVQVWNAYTGTPVAALEVPEGSPKSREKALMSGVKQIGGFFNASDNTPEARVHFPRLCQNIAQSRKGKSVMVVVIGGALFEDDGGDKLFSMRDGFCPTDGHFGSDNNLSIYSTKGREKALAGVVFHWATLNDNVYADSGHKASIERFWTAYVQEQGGVLASFQAAPSVAFTKALAGEKTAIATVTIDRSAKRGRVKVEKVEVPAAGAATDANDAKPLDESKKTSAASTDSVFKVTDTIETQKAKAAKLKDAKLDSAGNPMGAEFDLAPDATQSGTVLVLQLHTESDFDFAAPTTALQVKGFKVDRLEPPLPSVKMFSAKVAAASQVWLFSSKDGRLPVSHLRILEDAWRTRKLPLMIGADNEPFLVEARTLLHDLFGATIAGNFPGMNIVGPLRDGASSGGFTNHEIMTGVLRVYEGNTTCGLKGGRDFQPVLYGTEGHVLVAAYDKDGRRCVVDGGFTRLFNSHFHQTAGTERMVKNVACFLANGGHGIHPASRVRD